VEGHLLPQILDTYMLTNFLSTWWWWRPPGVADPDVQLFRVDANAFKNSTFTNLLKYCCS